MKFRKVVFDEADSVQEEAGMDAYSRLTSMVYLIESGLGFHNIYNLTLRIENIATSLWSLFPLKLAALNGDEDAISTFPVMIEQAKDQVNDLLELVSSMKKPDNH